MGSTYQEWKEIKKQQMSYARDARMAIAKNCRDMSIEIKRQKGIKNLSKWDDFRVRREEAIIANLKAKQRNQRCTILTKHAKTFLIL